MSEHGEAQKPALWHAYSQHLDRSQWGTYPAVGVLGVLCLLGSLIVWRPAVFATGDDLHTSMTLRGVQGIQVVVAEIDPDAERSGLNRIQLQAAIESWLRQAGIRVWPGQEGWVQAGRPTLYVRVTTAKDVRSGLYAINVSVELQQEVLLVHNSTLKVLAPTWRTAGIGILTAKQIPVIREDIGAYVADFIQDYLTVNRERFPEAVPPSPPEQYD